MKLTLNWLKEFVAFSGSPQQMAELLTMAGLEVESLAPVSSPEDQQDDWALEVAVTPNRGDCLSIQGLAREVAALRGAKLKAKATASPFAAARAEAPVKVEIRSPRCCRRYSAAVLDSVQVGASPAWMRFRLETCGIRSINNVVDVTNYVMLETGQPLHAFDLDRLGAKRIVVRQAAEIGKFVTLDEVERELAPEDLLICDGDVPVALAGIMGGRDSEVHAGTPALLLESAHFEPLTIRRTAKRLALHSEASHRFERGVDAEGTIYALDRAASLLAQVAGARPAGRVVDRYPRRAKAASILLRRQRAQDILGVELSAGEIEKILKSLGCKVQRRGKGAFQVAPPSARGDLSREADLIEEIARLRGYDKIPPTLPVARLHGERADARLRGERAMRSYLAGEGLTETIHLPFSSAELNRRFYGFHRDGAAAVAVLNPLVQESAEMRLSLLPGLIEDFKLNLAQRVKGFAGYALGKVFSLSPEGEPRERQQLAALVYGKRERTGLRVEPAPYSFLTAKGLVEGILEQVGIGERVAWTNSAVPAFLHPGQSACLELDQRTVGYVGEIHPDLSEGLSLPRYGVLELDFEGLVQYPPSQITVRSLPRFPSVERDMAVVVDESFQARRIIDWIKSLGHSLIENVEVFDHYRGANIPAGKKSLAYTISYRAEDRTLTDGEVQALHQELLSQMSGLFDAQLRG
ncbi:MAG: phenylalanine--tRNA ligase subunit beta [Deltaproteobacteria bacterium RIFCSPLOWO2_12_FULL_60_19]|nr:MAG: phenylalanine--tRNA ligase subunit beta [Deltaproteobacteria bacterium RIFCSPLOWO2_12_FULL_60_19]